METNLSNEKNGNRGRGNKLVIPRPAAPDRRKEPLPWQSPKAPEEDPGAATRVDALLNSPSYRRADQDIEFLGLSESRGARLALDYQKPELYLQRHGVKNTIVVYGSTRICEPAEARRRVAGRREALAADPDNAELQQKLRVAERIADKSKFYDIARELGRLVGGCGTGPEDSRLLLMTGGGPGIMEAANRGASDIGGKSIGLNITLPHEQFPNPYITPELCFSVRYFAIRKLHFLLRAKALVVFPGGYGTLDELFETLTLIQTRTIEPLPVILVGKEFWQRAFDPDFLIAEGVIEAEDRELFWYAETAEEIWQGIRVWHAEAGTEDLWANSD